jgi:3-oxoacyl-[acyl-carrier-protein] synthase II
VSDKTLLKQIRRADKLSKMAVLAAADALADSGVADIPQKRIGIILATAFGPHVTTFGFLDDILDYGDAGVSPTLFSNSVHNAATSYIATSLKIKGPTLTVSQFRFSFQSALQVAHSWLALGRCDYVLVGAADQYGAVLGYVADHKLDTAPDGRIKPFNFHPTCQVPGEGAAFFLLGRELPESAYGTLDAVYVGEEPVEPLSVDLDVIDADGLLADETAYAAVLTPRTPVAAYAPLFGSMMIGGAFSLAVAALILKRQTLFAAPVTENPRGLNIVTETLTIPVEAIRLVGCDCYGNKSALYLRRPS